MRRKAQAKTPTLLCALLAGVLLSQPSPHVRPGPQSDGSTLLVSGWKIRPAGKQLAVDTLPMSTALSRDGRYLIVLNGGYNPPSLSVIDVAAGTELSRTRLADGWLGLALSASGDKVYVGGGSRASVFELSFAEGKLTQTREMPLVEEAKRVWEDFAGDVQITPDGRFLYAAQLFRDSLAVLNAQTGAVVAHVKTGRRPYRIQFFPDGKTYLVTNWADGTLSQFQASDNAPMATLRLGAHPTDILLRAGKNTGDDTGHEWLGRVFVTASNTNSVHSIGVTENAELQHLETINVALTPLEPLGMTPSALGLSRDSNQLYIACSDANAVAVADISGDRTRVLGFIPTGWYPTAVRGLPDGRIAIANGKGLRSFPNPKGPSALKRPEPPHLGVRSDEYVGAIQRGSISLVDALDAGQLFTDTQTVLDNTPYRDARLNVQTPAALARIKHVIYVVKENRTYDPMFGDIKKGNGDPSLMLFPEKITPNQHKFADEFVLFDNFYVSSDVSADGHNWATAAIATDYTQKMWPNSYAARRKHYDYEGGEAANSPPAGYLWSNASMAGISVRNYGYFVNNRAKPGPDGIQVDSVRDPVLANITNRSYRGFDLEYSDVDRIKVFQKDLAEFESSGKMPQLMIMRLGNDHTNGTAAGKTAPLSLVADNDYALGLLVESVSHSRFWPETAIFVLEDDAQNGADHVDSHRSPAQLISPYTRGGRVDSTMYNTTSMLRTIELILGLHPMTHFDAAATPMTAAFGNADNAPYKVEPPRISLTDKNPANAPTAARSRKMNFEAEDLNDDDELNAVLWQAIRGPNAPVPAPVSAYLGPNSK